VRRHDEGHGSKGENAVAETSPTVRRRRLGLILRSMRERAGLTGEEVGSRIERSGSWVSRVETGRVGLRLRDLNDLLEQYRVSDPNVREELIALAREGKQRGWWSKFADTLTGPYATYIGFESEAAELLSYDTLVVNGMLQTEAYARSLIDGIVPHHTEDMIEKRVKIRMARQQLLTRARPVKLWAILDESVLYRQVGGADGLRAQLKHLLDVSAMPNVTIQVVSFDAGPHPGMIGSFTIVRFPSLSDPDIVYIEGVTGDIFAESEDALLYQEVFDHMRAAALSPSESRQKIERARDELA
jgi:transcriptional regulator with XRE-family HTH domain